MLQEWKSTVLELFFLPIWPPLGTDGKYSVLSCQGQVQEIFVRGEGRGAWKWRRSTESGADPQEPEGLVLRREGEPERGRGPAPTTVSHSPPLSSGAQLALHAAPAGHRRAIPPPPREGQESLMVEGRRVRQQPSGKHVTSGKLFNAPFIFSSVT